MALRPDNHITGDSAVRKIASDLIPEEWTISIPDSDYGLDMLVEVVRDNKTTGNLFFIQSKGTTESSCEGAISLSMNLYRIKDYSEIKLPVLLVYYSKTEKLFWGRWMNSLYSALTEEQKKQGTISLHFSFANVIDANYLRSIGEAIVPSITKSVSLRITELPEQFVRLHSQIIATAQRLIGSDIIGDSPLSCNKINLSYKGNIQAGSVEIRCGSSSVSITIRIPSSDILYYPPLSREECPQCVLDIIYTIALFSISISSQSFDYALTFPQKEALDYIADGIWMDLLNRVRAEDVHKVQGLFDLAIETNHEDLAQYVLFVVFAQNSKSHKIEVFYQSLLSRYLGSVQDNSSKGRLCYNLANSLRQIDCYEAFDMYINAVHYEPSYRKLFYWWEEIGSVLYLTSHYFFAELFYKHARSLSPNDCRKDIGLLIADCQICQGKIKEALSEESDFFDANENLSCSILLRTLVTEIMDQKGIQVFDPVYWFNLGVSYSNEGNHNKAMNCFLIAWRLYDGDLEALINAFIEAYESREEQKMALIIAVIRELAPEEGYKMLVSILVSNSRENPNIGVSLDALKRLFFQKSVIATKN